MKKILFLLAAFAVMAGCGPAGEGVEKDVFSVVEKHLENTAAGSWQEAFEDLAGEALAESRANCGRVRAVEKIISKKLKAHQVCRDVVEVKADITKSAGGGFDRQAYRFRLKREGGRWLIYSADPGEYIHPGLRPGQLPPGAGEAVREYIELPFSAKRNLGQYFLAGKILNDHRKAGALPVDQKTASVQEMIATRVKSLDCLGVSEDYAVVLADYEISRDGKVFLAEAVVDVVKVNGKWKISRIDISKI